jgi:hypothetical protein
MPSVDMDKVVNSTVQQLGAENALLRLELNAQHATWDALARAGEEKDAEIARLRHVVEQLQQRAEGAEPGDPPTEPSTPA